MTPGSGIPSRDTKAADPSCCLPCQPWQVHRAQEASRSALSSTVASRAAGAFPSLATGRKGGQARDVRPPLQKGPGPGASRRLSPCPHSKGGSEAVQWPWTPGCLRLFEAPLGSPGAGDLSPSLSRVPRSCSAPQVPAAQPSLPSCPRRPGLCSLACGLCAGPARLACVTVLSPSQTDVLRCVAGADPGLRAHWLVAALCSFGRFLKAAFFVLLPER